MTRLIVISAPSGAGKTTLCQRALADFSELTLSISTTTRAPRGRERDGVEYHFVTRERFEKEISEGCFAEWALVHGNYYGTSREAVDRAFSSGRSVLLDIDVQGAETLRKSYPKESVLIFIAPPSMEELERRLRLRKTDNEETIRTRLRNARSEMDKIGSFDHVIVNSELGQAYDTLRRLLQSVLPGARNG